ncbi:uncharacterized protein V6R79_007473 [Siganus canaliculatus]
MRNKSIRLKRCDGGERRAASGERQPTPRSAVASKQREGAPEQLLDPGPDPQDRRGRPRASPGPWSRPPGPWSGPPGQQGAPQSISWTLVRTPRTLVRTSWTLVQTSRTEGGAPEQRLPLSRRRGRGGRSKLLTKDRSRWRSNIRRRLRPQRCVDKRCAARLGPVQRPIRSAPPDQNQPEPTRANQSQPEPTRANQNQPEPTRTNQNQPEPTRANQNQPEPTRTDQNQPEPTRTDQNRPEPTRTNQNQPEPTRTNISYC